MMAVLMAAERRCRWCTCASQPHQVVRVHSLAILHLRASLLLTRKTPSITSGALGKSSAWLTGKSRKAAQSIFTYAESSGVSVRFLLVFFHVVSVASKGAVLACRTIPATGPEFKSNLGTRR